MLNDLHRNNGNINLKIIELEENLLKNSDEEMSILYDENNDT